MSWLWNEILQNSLERAIVFGVLTAVAIALLLAATYFLYAISRLTLSRLKGSADLNLDVTNFASYTAATSKPNPAKFIELGITISTKGLPSYIRSISLQTNADPEQRAPKRKLGLIVGPTPKSGGASDNWFDIECEISDRPQIIFVLFEVFCANDKLDSKELSCHLEVVTTRGWRKKIDFLVEDV